MGVKFNFLNVGDGDCTIVEFPERIVESTRQEKDARVMMVDINHHEYHEEYEHIIDYYKKNIGSKPIFRFIVTHPQKDHITGIKNLFEENGINILNFWDLEHSFEPDKTGSFWDEYKEDWNKYAELRKQSFVRRYWDEDSGIKYWDEDKIEILSPSKGLHHFVHYNEDDEERDSVQIGQLINNLSYVLLIRVNSLKILLAADAEEQCWEYIIKQHADKIGDIDILKAAHHGRLTGVHEEAVKLMKPKHLIFSMSNAISQSDYSAEEEYKRIVPGVSILKTSDLGSIILDCDFDGTITHV